MTCERIAESLQVATLATHPSFLLRSQSQPTICWWVSGHRAREPRSIDPPTHTLCFLTANAPSRQSSIALLLILDTIVFEVLFIALLLILDMIIY
jgi:hypothetical protein